MRWIGVYPLASALACASTSSSSSPGGSSGAQRSDAQSCPSGQVAAVIERDTDVYPSPDSTSPLIGSFNSRGKGCPGARAGGLRVPPGKVSTRAEGVVEAPKAPPRLA